MYLKQKRSKTRTNDDRRNALLWEIKARETDDVKRMCQYYYCSDIHYFCKEQIKLLRMWQSKDTLNIILYYNIPYHDIL